MSAGSAGSSGRFFSPTVIRIAGAIAIVALVGGLIAGAQPRPPVTHFEDPRAQTEAWAPLQLSSLEPVADLSAAPTDAAGIATTAVFTLRSRTSTPAVELAAHLSAEPAIAFQVKAGPSPDVATLSETTPLAASTRYRFHLTAPDGSAAGSWTFRTKGPLQVVGRLPDDHATGVPIDTGIEVTFDREGTSDFESHFSIDPPVTGRFETHGGAWVFVPSQKLKPATIYTYTVSPGVSLPGSDVILAEPIHVTFETAPATASAGEVELGFQRSVFDVVPDTRPVLGISIGEGEKPGTSPKTLTVQAYRLPAVGAAITAAETIAEGSWAEWSEYGLVSTTGLSRVADTTVPVSDNVQGSAVLRLPFRLAAGWYLVNIPRAGRDAQAVVQVTSLAVYALSSVTRTVVWINDMATGKVVPGATVTLPDGSLVGRTDASGLMNATTPAELRAVPKDRYSDGDIHFLAIRASGGRASFAELGARSGDRYRPEDLQRPSPDPWWDLVQVDRALYRPTDTIHIWGFVQARSDRHVPASLELRVAVSDGASTPLQRQTVVPTARGTFAADIRLTNVPMDQYNVLVYAGDEVVSMAWFAVGDIRKPSYELTLDTKRHVYIAGDPIGFTTSAAFFDGTRAPGLDLRVGPDVYEGSPQPDTTKAVTTDGQGLASGTIPAWIDRHSGWSSMNLNVRPVSPEEGEISGSTQVAVFPSSDWLSANASVVNGQLVVGGHLNQVDFARLEREVARGMWPEDPSGAPIVGRTMTIRVVHLIPVVRQVGTDYDFVEKHVVPIYEYDVRRVSLPSHVVTSSAKGAIGLSMPVPVAADQYEVTLSATDARGRLIELTIMGERPATVVTPTTPLALTGPSEAHVGHPITVTLTRGPATVTGGAFLFIVGRAGIQAAITRSTGTYTRTFRDADLPNIGIRAVRWTSTGYQTADYGVAVAPSDNAVKLALMADRATYAPGDTVAVDIRTTLGGQPIATDVVLRAVDQKLYAIGAAYDPDSLAQLLSWVGYGFLGSYTSQFAPGPAFPDGGGMGDEGGGGREDFRDSATFQIVSTDRSGRARITFKLPDDLTTWHLAASAFSAHLDAGDAALLIPVGLPFFVEAILAPEYLVGEQPVLRIRAYGPSLAAGDPVHFSVSASSLGLADVSVDGRAFDSIRIPLPTLTAGDHRITIRGQKVGGTEGDALVRTLHVVATRVSILQADFEALTGSFQPSGGPGFSTYVITDAGRGALLPLLESMASTGSARFERSVSAEIARQLLLDEFEVSADNVPPSGYDATRYQREDGVAVVPYASGDLELAARAAIVVGGELDAGQLRRTLDNRRVELEQAPITGDDVALVQTLAGLASLGGDVLPELARIADKELSIRSRIWLGLGFLAAGDEASARTIERAMLNAHGQGLGAWVRVSNGAATNKETSLMLLLAAGLGDPLAASMSSYLAENSKRDELFVLEQLGYVRAMLDRLPRTASRFAWTVDGQRHDVSLEPGGSLSLTLTAQQRATLHIEPVAGQLTVASLWQGPLSSSTFLPGSGVKITRTVSPAGNAPDDHLVTVTIRVTFGASAPTGCYRVTDTVPSGLAPLGVTATWEDGESGAPPPTSIRPYEVQGQRVSWCVDRGETRPLAYLARVVSPGTFTWEPAVVQLETAPSFGAFTEPTTYTIH